MNVECILQYITTNKTHKNINTNNTRTAVEHVRTDCGHCDDNEVKAVKPRHVPRLKRHDEGVLLERCQGKDSACRGGGRRSEGEGRR